MQWSKIHIPTLRQPPNDAEVPSHRLLVQGGFIRQIAAGVYNLLPLAKRSMHKIESIIRQEMNAIGGQEFELAALLPAEPWIQSGRWDVMGDNMFRLKDRKKSDFCLGMTHEEIFALLAHSDLRSYKELPQIWYQIQTKFRDEPRPKSGLLRVRQFTMKDSYSFDADTKGLDESFQAHRTAYQKIYSRCGIPFVIVEADTGTMGGSASQEFMVETDAGEDLIAKCDGCGYAANVEKAKGIPTPSKLGEKRSIEKFATPGVKTIEALTKLAGGAPAEGQIKTLVLHGKLPAGGRKTALFLIRGDHTLNEVKAANLLGAMEVYPAVEKEIFEIMKAHPGSLGAVQFSLKDIEVFADEVLKDAEGMVTGANEDGFHYRGVSTARDLKEVHWADLRSVQAGETCSSCKKGKLRITKCLEVGHIFKLGTKYSKAMDAQILDQSGARVPMVMGSYGIGPGRILASAIEVYHDENGIRFPISIAPFEVVITALSNEKSEDVQRASAELYSSLLKQGWDVLFDDRAERAGVKFKDADLIGIPIRIVIGDRALKEKKIEVHCRWLKQTENIPMEQLSNYLAELKKKILPAEFSHA